MNQVLRSDDKLSALHFESRTWKFQKHFGNSSRNAHTGCLVHLTLNRSVSGYFTQHRDIHLITTISPTKGTSASWPLQQKYSQIPLRLIFGCKRITSASFVHMTDLPHSMTSTKIRYDKTLHKQEGILHWCRLVYYHLYSSGKTMSTCNYHVNPISSALYSNIYTAFSLTNTYRNASEITHTKNAFDTSN